MNDGVERADNRIRANCNRPMKTYSVHVLDVLLKSECHELCKKIYHSVTSIDCWTKKKLKSKYSHFFVFLSSADAWNGTFVERQIYVSPCGINIHYVHENLKSQYFLLAFKQQRPQKYASTTLPVDAKAKVPISSVLQSARCHACFTGHDSQWGRSYIWIWELRRRVLFSLSLSLFSVQACSLRTQKLRKEMSNTHPWPSTWELQKSVSFKAKI